MILQWKSRNQAPQVLCELFTQIISKGNTSNFLSSSPSYVIKIKKINFFPSWFHHHCKQNPLNFPFLWPVYGQEMNLVSFIGQPNMGGQHRHPTLICTKWIVSLNLFSPSIEEEHLEIALKRLPTIWFCLVNWAKIN